VIDPLGVLLGLWVLDAVLMAVFWLWALRLKNAGFVDLGWSLGIGFDALAILLWSGARSLPCWILAVGAWLWALRLAFYLGRRVIGKPEDPRFTALRKDWRERGRPEMAVLFGIFQLQGFLSVVFSLPVFLACLQPRPWNGVVVAAGAALIAVGLIGESLADAQLARHRESGRRSVCREGLWAYSRHPNYFFEFLFWLGMGVGALAVPGGFLALVCPALILFFLLRVTGIPATEAHALESRGEEYRRYQKEVSAFVPLPPRRDRGT